MTQPLKILTVKVAVLTSLGNLKSLAMLYCLTCINMLFFTYKNFLPTFL